jgi:septum formation protein
MDGDNYSQRTSLWKGAAPFILASKSLSRRALLADAGLIPEVVQPDVDERAVERDYVAEGGAPGDLASALAQAKARAVSAIRPYAYCLGADQTLILDDRVIHKPRNVAEAAERIATLAGRTHRLISAFCIALSGKTLVADVDYAELQMRLLQEDTITEYLNLAGSVALSSVGAYQVEGLGIHLFDRIDGDHRTILGIPMLKLLAWLRRENLISL